MVEKVVNLVEKLNINSHSQNKVATILEINSHVPHAPSAVAIAIVEKFLEEKILVIFF